MKKNSSLIIILILLAFAIIFFPKLGLFSALFVSSDTQAGCENARQSRIGWKCLTDCFEITEQVANCVSGYGYNGYQNKLGRWYLLADSDFTCRESILPDILNGDEEMIGLYYCVPTVKTKVGELCSNECTPIGRQCIGTSGYTECSDFDSDGCLELRQITCSQGSTCQNGICIGGTQAVKFRTNDLSYLLNSAIAYTDTCGITLTGYGATTISSSGGTCTSDFGSSIMDVPGQISGFTPSITKLYRSSSDLIICSDYQANHYWNIYSTTSPKVDNTILSSTSTDSSKEITCQSSCNTPADTDCNGQISFPELNIYAQKWANNQGVTFAQLIEAANVWILSN